MKKSLLLILALVFLVGVLGSCGAANTPSTSESSGAATTVNAQTSSSTQSVDNLKQVKLKMFAIMDAPKNQDLSDQFYKVLNEKLTKELHCTVELNYAAGNDFKNNYELAVASGEKYDIMHAASGWLDYQKYASKGAFLPLDDMIPQYASYLQQKIPQKTWTAVKVNGKIYGIPTLKTTWCEPTFMYREDIRKKLNLPEVDSYEHIATYLQGIADHSKELGGILPSSDYQAQVYATSWIYTTPYMGVDEVSDRRYNFVLDPKDPTKVLSAIETPEYKKYMYTMKEWADKGYWTSSCLTSTDWGVMSVLDGKAAASFNEQLPPYAYHATYIKTQHPDWELGFFLYSQDSKYPNSVVRTQSSTSGLMAVAKTAENPERALMFINYLQQNPDLWKLCYYGMEGVNYKLTDGMLDKTGINEDTNGFNYFPADIIGNSEFELKEVNRWSRYDEYVQMLKDKTVDNILDGFVLDTSGFEAEYTALYNVSVEYGFPLEAGLVKDVDAAYKTYIEKAKAAGLDKVREGVEKQVQAFLASKK
jgi:ABC-type sugar transport system, periplasmic component